MNGPASLYAEAKPYKGPESYQIEDGDIFFGREREADQLIANILSSRFTLLHSPSGAGKTSLLNARVIPGLISRGWGAFRILPQNDPIESILSTTLQYVIPPPEAELDAIKRARQAFTELDDDPALDTLLSYYDGLAVRDARRRALVAPIQTPSSANHLLFPASAQVNPWFCRLLRSTIEIDEFAEHVAALHPRGDAFGLMRTCVDGGTRVSDLVDMLSQPIVADSYRKLLSQLFVPVRDLPAFFENLVQTYGRRRSRFALVLIFDQFEELFTRFIDPGPVPAEYLTDLPDWRVRWEFFDQLEGLYSREFAPIPEALKSKAESVKTLLPIRYVISMRDEYIAQLDPIRRFVWDLDSNSYHMGLLEKDEATAAIREPAALFGYAYSDDCYMQIIKQLTKEDRFVEPAHLQVVCEKLWNVRGRELAGHVEKIEKQEGREPFPRIELQTFRDMGQVEGILKSFFGEFLEGLDDPSRLETLEMLEPLITGSGTRNILERDELLRAPFRDEARRDHLLRNLVDRRIVRIERRLGGYFVEITHEFLIGPILEAVRTELSRDAEHSRFRWILHTLERFENASFDVGGHSLLTLEEFFSLHRNRQSVKWNDWSTELMLRSAISLGAERHALRVWVDQFGASGRAPDVSALLAAMSRRSEGRKLLTLEELRLVNEQRTALTLSPKEIELVLRSELIRAVDIERCDVVYWTRRLMSDES